ncbi:MAG: restriction endonuclease subunit S [Pyrinomonadaceae bacterium]|nr:restriction endonuclease subunit S [Chloracidobacterium sp.]
MNNWTVATIGEFASLQRGHDLPDGSRREGKIPILGSFGITGFHDVAKEKGPGVTIGRSGSSFGVVTFSKVNFWPLNTTLFVKDFHGNNEKFVYYFFKAFDFSSYNSGSAQASLNRNYVHPVRIQIPSRAEQDGIASILSSLDDKIELNRRMNQTLEAMARALFKAWFVDFESVHANLENRPSTSASPEIAKLFPSDFENGIPKGWQIKKMAECIEVGIGKTPPRKEPQWFSEDTTNVRWVSIRNMGATGMYTRETSEYLTADAVKKFNVRIVPDNTVLLSFKLTVGRVCITDGECTTNEAIAHFVRREQSKLNPYYLYLYLRAFDYSSLGSTSSIATAVNSKSIRDMPILAPQGLILDEFEKIIQPIFEKIKTNQREIETLGEIRDSLLPRLISGKLRVGDFETEIVQSV